LEVYGFCQAEFGLTSRAFVLLCLLVLLLILVQVVASAIAALIRGDWRKTVSSLTAVAASFMIVLGAFALPIEWRFSFAARPHYEAELMRAGNPDRQTWMLDAQFLGPNQADLVYDESDGAAPPHGLRSYVKDDGECSLSTERLDGHFYLKSYVC
jgi:hypothetical protein